MKSPLELFINFSEEEVLEDLKLRLMDRSRRTGKQHPIEVLSFFSDRFMLIAAFIIYRKKRKTKFYTKKKKFKKAESHREFRLYILNSLLSELQKKYIYKILPKKNCTLSRIIRLLSSLTAPKNFPGFVV